uniref:Uncharacterized protein n=1 Tax=Arundo donax TaxID=35708 RepID=A0A0A9G6L4_ARUDO
MGLQSVTFLDKKLMLQDLFASYLMTWNQEYQYNSASLLMKHAIKLSVMKEMCDKREF